MPAKKIVSWDNNVVEKFEAVDGTVYTRGPFSIEYVPGKTANYDYKLEDTNGEDYCDIQQMKWWGVELKQILI